MPSPRFRFGLYEFDSGTRELRREGAIVHLQAQPAQVLACLLDRAGEALSREELRSAIWGESTFVDFDRGLNFCISQVRAALHDSATDPTYIRTVAKHGYRFIAPVERIGGEERKSMPAAGAAPSRIRVLAVVSALIVLATLALTSGRSWPVNAQSVAEPVVAVLRFDNETGNADNTRISDALTDLVVEQLTSQGAGHFEVIGNAQALRVPREQRDIRAIGATLHAAYIILGQVQKNGDGTRILAHLIRLPEQTHLRVVRLDRPGAPTNSLEDEAAQKIASEFSRRITNDAAAKAFAAAAAR